MLLRVFGFRARTERLFDHIAMRWLHHGPVTMIAAPDLTARTVDPVDFPNGLLGRVDRSFVRSAGELQARLGAIEHECDPDGRFRVSEFCCADDTWRATAVELMARADLVLMGLRGFTNANAGCEYELRQLAAHVDPRRVVLLVEPGSARAILRAWLGEAANAVRGLQVPSRSGRLPAGQLPVLLEAAQCLAATKWPDGQGVRDRIGPMPTP